MLSKAAKNEIVKEFSEVFKTSPSVVLIEYKGLTVTELQRLRSKLKGAETELKVVKNTLLKIAAQDTEIEQLSDKLTGPTAIAVCESDAAAAAKVFVDSAKDLPSLVIKGGIIEGNVVGFDEITAISKLPSRHEMMAQLLGALSSPMSNLLGALTQMQTKLLYALEALKDVKEQGGAGVKEEVPAEVKEEIKAESEAETKPASSEKSVVEAKEESKEAAPAAAKEENKTESKEEAPVVEAKEENKAESKEEAPVEAKAESGAKVEEYKEAENKE